MIVKFFCQKNYWTIAKRQFWFQSAALLKNVPDFAAEILLIFHSTKNCKIRVFSKGIRKREIPDLMTCQKMFSWLDRCLFKGNFFQYALQNEAAGISFSHSDVHRDLFRFQCSRRASTTSLEVQQNVENVRVESNCTGRAVSSAATCTSDSCSRRCPDWKVDHNELNKPPLDENESKQSRRDF